MKTIRYGYLTKDKKIIVEKTPIYNIFWYNNYILQDSNELNITKTGNCFDQTEFARNWFINNNYEVKAFNIQANDLINTSHSFVAYKDKISKDKWNWFEIAWKNQRGIHSYNSLKELLINNYKLYMEELKNKEIKTLEKITLYSFPIPKKHSTINKYITNLKKGKKLVLKENR